jgi:hypothetical protein
MYATWPALNTQLMGELRLGEQSSRRFLFNYLAQRLFVHMSYPASSATVGWRIGSMLRPKL